MTDQKTRVAVGLGDSLPEVLNRLHKSAGASVSLDIPDASSLFLTASEFRALQAVAERDHVTVSVTTDDPLRQQLAALFKLPVEAPEIGTELVATGTEPPPPEETPSPEPQPPPESEDPTPKSEAVVESSAPPSVLRRGRLGTKSTKASTISSETPAPSPSSITDEAAPETTPESSSRLSRAASRIRGTTTRQRVITVGTLVAILLLAYLAAFQFLTRATVVLTLKRQTISQDLTVGIAAPGASQPAADVTLAATPVTFAVSTAQTLNATGAKTVGDTPAQGSIVLSNPTGQPVTVEAGTQLEDKITGTKYAIVATVEVVAGKDGAPGYGETQVTCLEPGTIGNREIGFLSGQLANSLYYANRESPIAGGTDKQVPVVTQADLDTLQTMATDDMKAQAARQSPGPDLVVLAPSVQLGQPSFTFDHQVDQESATVTVQATAQAAALAYSPTELRARVTDTLAATAPAGYQIDLATLQLSEPTATSGNQQEVILTVRADGSALATLTPENKNRVASTIAGEDEAAAKSYLAALPGVESFTIDYSPGWLPHRIPSSADRVEVETK